jgi:hypothetical protein
MDLYLYELYERKRVLLGSYTPPAASRRRSCLQCDTLVEKSRRHRLHTDDIPFDRHWYGMTLRHGLPGASRIPRNARFMVRVLFGACKLQR